MLNIYICEDDLKQLEMYTKIIENIRIIENLDTKIALSTTRPEELLNDVQKSKNCGIYFLDIELNSTINGVELAQKIREYDPRGFIIFITTYKEMVPLTFKYKVEALDYIVKDDFKFGGIKSKIKECMLDAQRKYTSKTDELHKNFIIQYNDKIITIEFDEILYFETSSPHKVILNGVNRQFEFRGNMKDVKKRLDERFVRCHQSFIVNKGNIESIDKKNKVIYLINGESCLASKQGIKELMQSI